MRYNSFGVDDIQGFALIYLMKYGSIFLIGGGRMDFDFYGNAVQEYMTEFAENTRRILKKIKIPQEEIELAIQEEQEKIEKL